MSGPRAIGLGLCTVDMLFVVDERPAFDITMRAPFQGLFYSVRLLDDPTFLVGEAIRRQRRETTIETGAERAVQGQESDDLP